MGRRKGKAERWPFAFRRWLRYCLTMAKLRKSSAQTDTAPPTEKSVTPEHYAAWKEAKIRAALAETDDRSTLIPASDVWEQFGFER